MRRQLTRKFEDADVRMIRTLRSYGFEYWALARMFAAPKRCIERISCYLTYRDLKTRI